MKHFPCSTRIGSRYSRYFHRKRDPEPRISNAQGFPRRNADKVGSVVGPATRISGCQLDLEEDAARVFNQGVLESRFRRFAHDLGMDMAQRSLAVP